jgi:hypothetical protein
MQPGIILLAVLFDFWVNHSTVSIFCPNAVFTCLTTFPEKYKLLVEKFFISPQIMVFIWRLAT